MAASVVVVLLISDIVRIAERYDPVCAKAASAIRKSGKKLIPQTQFEDCEVSMKREVNGFGGHDFTQVITLGSFEPYPRRLVDTHTVRIVNGEVVQFAERSPGDSAGRY